MPAIQAFETTKNLMRPSQIVETKDELQRLEKQIKHPDVQDRPTMLRQIKAMKHKLDTETPTPFSSGEIDKAVREEAALREKLTGQMLSAEEMRRMKKDSAHKHLAFEQHNKQDILRWKYLRQRLYAGSDDPNVANLEAFRPHGRPADQLIEGLVPHKDIHLPKAVPVPGAVMSDAERDALRAIDPELLDRMAMMTGEQRAQVLALVRKLSEGEVKAEPQMDTPRKRTPKPLTAEDRKAIGRRLAEARRLKRLAREGE